MKTTYRIRPLPTIQLKVDVGIFTYRMNYGKKMWAPVFMWYIEGTEKRILVDSGAEAAFAQEFRGLQAQELNSFDKALRSVGLEAKDIDLVIQTHLHWDHCYNTSKCINAKTIVQESELKFAFSPHPLVANLYHKPLFDSLNFMVVNGQKEIAPGIELIPAPGHSPGIQAVSIDTEQGKAIISGCCVVKENFEPSDEMRKNCPVLPPGTHTNVIDGFDSMLRIKGMADILIPQHDPQFLETKSIP